MRRGLLLTGLLLLSACGAPVTNDFVANPDLTGRITTASLGDQLIVKYKGSDFTTKGAELLYRMPGSVVIDSFSGAGGLTELHRVPAGTRVKDALDRYGKDPTVEAAMPNEVWRAFADAPETGHADPRLGEQWHVEALDLPEVWERTEGEGVTVAVIDSGIDPHHPEFVGRLAAGGYDFVDKDADPTDGNGHGTHVAGIIAAARNNGTGVAGIAPKARILPLRVLNDKGYGSTFAILKALGHATKMGAKVINLSLGGPPPGLFSSVYWSLYGRHLEKKGVLLVAAAGNEAGAVGTPAALKPFLAVSAINSANKLASFSNFGKQVSVTAPGVNILSTMPTYPCYMTTAYADQVTESYAALSGTSMATPLVAGTAALIWSLHPDWKPAQVREAIEKTAHDLGPAGRDAQYGFGRIRPLAALGE